MQLADEVLGKAITSLIELDPVINELVELQHVNAKPGDYIDTFEDASKAIGVVLARCNEQYDYQTLMKHFDQCVKIRKDG